MHGQQNIKTSHHCHLRLHIQINLFDPDFCNRDRPKLLGPEDDDPPKRRQIPADKASFTIRPECLSTPLCEPQILQTTLFLPRSCDP